MKHLILIAVLALGSLNAFGYSSNPGADPINGSPDLESKVVVKSTVNGVSDAISKGDILSYSSTDGYTVSRVGANSAAGANLMACVADRAIATSNSATVARANCLTKGYVDFLSYDATTPIVAGTRLCVNTLGRAVTCAADATANSGIIALEAKASGTGSNLKAIINLQ